MSALRTLFLSLIARPIAQLFTGADVIGRERLPLRGPAIIAANHTSHVDTVLLLTIFPAASMKHLRPVAAADYFLRDPVIGWFSQTVIGIVPVSRGHAASGEDVLAPARAALEAGDIVIIFPEGTRGNDDDGMAPLKAGVARLAEAFPDAPVTPVWLQGAGRVLPKGARVPVPMNCTVLVGAPMAWSGKRSVFMEGLRDALLDLKAQAPPQKWRDIEPS